MIPEQPPQPSLAYDRQRFGKAVRRFRGDQASAEFAATVPCTPAVLSRMERGKVVDPSFVLRLCEMMGVSIGQFPAGAAGNPDSA